jgi:hypothetical protein
MRSVFLHGLEQTILSLAPVAEGRIGREIKIMRLVLYVAVRFQRDI